MNDSSHNWDDGIYLHAIIEKSHAALSIDLHLGYIFYPIPMLEGISIQEGSVCASPYTLGASSWGVLGMVTFI